MDFYDDIDVDFGNVGDLINMMDRTTTKPANDRIKKEIIFEDELEDEECENFNVHRANFTNSINPDVDSICKEVSEVTGDRFLNEQIEKQYKIINRMPEPIKVKKVKKKSTVPKDPKTSNITKKSDLRKEMASGEADGKVGFTKKKNVLVSSLIGKKPEPDSPEPEDIQNRPQAVVDQVAEAVEVEKDYVIDVPANKTAMDRVLVWLSEIPAPISEDEFYSMDESSNTTGGSDYLTASTCCDETPKKVYRATSKRSSLTRVSPITTDDKVGFKKTPTKANPSAKPPETYVPGSYNKEFKLKSKDFPAIR